MKTTKLLAHPKANENSAYWKRHTQLCAESGLSKSTYCKQQDVNYPRFIYWAKKVTGPALPDLIEVKLKPEMTLAQPLDEVRCTLQLKNNICLRIESQQALLILLAQFR